MIARLVSLLLPVLFPSWRFFKDVGPSPRIEVPRDGRWVEVLPRPDRLSVRRRCVRLFFNRDWNETLFLCSLADRLLSEGKHETAAMLQARLSRYLDCGSGDLTYRIVLIERTGAGLSRSVAYEHGQ